MPRRGYSISVNGISKIVIVHSNVNGAIGFFALSRRYGRSFQPKFGGEYRRNKQKVFRRSIKSYPDDKVEMFGTSVFLV